MKIPGITQLAEKFGSKQISVVVPSYNEANTVGHVLSEVLKLREVGELILVDDGSKDTGKILCRQLSRKYKNVHFYSFQKNMKLRLLEL